MLVALFASVTRHDQQKISILESINELLSRAALGTSFPADPSQGMFAQYLPFCEVLRSLRITTHGVHAEILPRSWVAFPRAARRRAITRLFQLQPRTLFRRAKFPQAFRGEQQRLLK